LNWQSALFRWRWGSIATLVIQNQRNAEENKLRYLDYTVRTQDKLINPPRIPARKLELLLDGKPLESISKVVVEIYNFSDRDYDDVPVYLELKSDDGNLDVISQEVTGRGGVPESVTEIPLNKPSETTGALGYCYKINPVNRSSADSLWYAEPAFRTGFLVRGGTAPKVDVKTSKKGVELRPLQYASPRGIFGGDWVLGTLWLLLVASPALLFLFAWTARRQLSKFDEKLRSDLTTFLSQADLMRELQPDVKSPVVAELLIKFLRAFRWENTGRIERWFYGMPRS